MLEIDSPIHFYYIAKNGQNINKNSLFVFYIKKCLKINIKHIYLIVIQLFPRNEQCILCGTSS